MGQTKIKKLLKLVLPPILIPSIRYVRSFFYPDLEYTPDGWDTALYRLNNVGWNSTHAVEAERLKWQSYRDALNGTGPLAFMHEHIDPTELNNSFHNRNITLAYVFALAALNKNVVTVLDYGGSLGHNYQFAKTILTNKVTIDFHCKEVPKLVDIGRSLNPDVTWHSDDTCLYSQYDLIIVNGVLQYIKDWRHFLKRMALAVKEYLFIGHLPLVDNCSGFVAVQRRYGTEMLHEQFNGGTILEEIKDTGLCLIREFLTGIHPYIKNAPEQCELRSWLFKRRK